MILESVDAQSMQLQKTKEGPLEPPPYSRSPSSSSSLPPPPPRRIEDPSTSSRGALTKPQPSLPRLTPAPRASVTQLHIYQKADPISGTFFVDPRIPSTAFEGKGRKKNPPHASFRTRHAPISLDLSTTGDVSALAPKANILVASRSGNISVKLLPTAPSRPRIGLEAESRRGNIQLFVPANFSGVLQLTTRKGSIQLLPAIASKMKVLKESDTEALVLIGDQASAVTGTRDMDFCQLSSRSGKLVVGLSDVDKIEMKVGFWQKIANAFAGGH